MKNISSLRPRETGCYGINCPAFTMGVTWLESEEVQNDYGQFKRIGVVIHEKTRQLIKVRADIADTYFSIPATTATETGYVTADNDGNILVFRPHTEQDQTPAEYRKGVKKAYK
jgi:hypothetical protein